MAKINYMDRENILREYEVSDEPVSMGREATNKIVVADPSVSRQHAWIEKREDGYYLIDKNSSNGTYVNGKKITVHKLQHEDKINLGSASLVFEDEEEGSATFILSRGELPEAVDVHDRVTDELSAQSAGEEAPLPPPPPLVSTAPEPPSPPRPPEPPPPPPKPPAPPPAAPKPPAPPPAAPKPPAPPPPPAAAKPPAPEPPPPAPRPQTVAEGPGILCPFCRKVVDKGSRFCPSCGKPLGASEEAGAPERPAAPPPPPAAAPKPPSPPPPPAPSAAPRPVPPPPSLGIPESPVRAHEGELVYAGFMPRLVAYLIDYALLMGILLLPAVAAYVTVLPLQAGQQPTPLSMIILAVCGLVITLLGLWYQLYFVGAKGATPGKKIMKLRVTFPDGTWPVGYGKAFLRMIGFVISIMICYIGVIMIALDKEQHKGLHDKIAGTVVIRE